MFQDAATIGVLFFLGFVGLGLSILTVLRFWLVDDVLEGAIAVGLICSLLLVSAWMLRTSSPWLMLLWIVVMIGGSLAWPVLSAMSDQNSLRQIHEEKIQKYQNILAHDVQNAAAWRELGEVYFKLDRYDEAIAAYKEAIRLNPHDVQEVRRRLNRALDYRADLPAHKRVVCKICNHENAGGTSCTHCGAIIETSFFDWFLHPHATREVLPATLAIMAGVVAVGVLFTPLIFPAKAAIMAVCLALGAFLLWRAAQATG